jgi:hypothetical protein
MTHTDYVCPETVLHTQTTKDTWRRMTLIAQRRNRLGSVENLLLTSALDSLMRTPHDPESYSRFKMRIPQDLHALISPL